MAFEGYIRYGGVELVNNARLSAYTTNLGIDGYRCSDICPSLPAALEAFPPGDVGKWKPPGPYLSPIASPHPPWYDSAEPHSVNFAGIHVLEWSNIDSSTYSATSQELVGDGASISGERFAGREMTVRCLLLGTDLLACRHGFNWLTAVLRDGDPCAKNERRHHTYGDFLPFGKEWWSQYKRDDAEAIGDNVYQALRYNGMATSDDTAGGNTYARLSHAEGDPTIDPPIDLLDVLIPLNAADSGAPRDPGCGGNSLEFFVQCPTPEITKDVYRVVYDVKLLSGPVIVSEHEMGVDCSSGAWYEVEFVIMGTNPFVWRWPNDMLATEHAFSYAQVMSHWVRYKDEATLVVDDDMYQAPLFWDEPHTYSGLVSVMFEMATAPPPARVSGRAVTQDAVLVLDPLCAPVVAYPGAPQEDFLCAPVFDGEYNSLRYSFLADTLPKFTPTTVRFRLVSESVEPMRDIKVRIIPPSGSEVGSRIVEFNVTYLPPRSQMFIDGVRKSIDVLTGDPGDPSVQVWSPAEHLVLSTGGVGSYTFPEITCGRDVSLAIDIPSIYDPEALEFDLVTVQRDA